jgi:SM-20-related protein
MSCPASPGPCYADTAFDRFAPITSGLADQGWVVVDDFIPLEWAAELREEQQRQYRRGLFRSAATGRGASRLLDSQTRGDEVLWLDHLDALPAQCQYLALLEDLRLAVNRDLMLGLYQVEAHATIYHPGSFYRRHLDAFRLGNLRTVSIILYLDPRWHQSDGGALRLFLDGLRDSEFLDITPQGGRLVAFLSERFHHEVLVTRRMRSSITGWFSRRPLQ